MKLLSTVFALCAAVVAASAQVLPAARAVDWSQAGLVARAVPTFFHFVDLSTTLVGDGATNNSLAMQAALVGLGTTPTVLQLPTGNFLFQSPILLPDNVILRGQGMDSTKLIFALGGTGHCIQAVGSQTNSDSTHFTASVAKGAQYLPVTQPSRYAVGTFVRIVQNDSSFMYSTWAYRTLGQILRVDSVDANGIYVNRPLRRAYDLARRPHLVRLNMRRNIGIECLYIDRTDASTSQTDNVLFAYGYNCWVRGVESNRCNFAHICLEACTNIEIRGNYLHHGHNYGGGGKAYGVVMQYTTGECLVEDNIFRNLRHSVLLQASPNGNVVAYNYSRDPFWNEGFFPTNSAGDLVLHGNYPYANLFEGNIAQNIVIDNSHDANGEDNVFFRNRAELYGIFFSDASSPNQIFIANEVPNTTAPFGLYNLQGTGHFEYANNHRGTIRPAGTDATPLLDTSYYRSFRPSHLYNTTWAGIGFPYYQTNTNPAKERYTYLQNGANYCASSSTPYLYFPSTTTIQATEDAGSVYVPVRIANAGDTYARAELGFIAGGTSAIEGTDFAALSGVFYDWLPMNNEEGYLRIDITDDNTVENTETIRLVLRAGYPHLSVLQDSTLFIQILDNDVVAVDEPSSSLQPLVKVFPNPSTGSLYLHTPAAWHSHSLRLFDALGREVFHAEGEFAQPLSLPAALTDGLYFLRLESRDESGNRQTHSQRLRLIRR